MSKGLGKTQLAIIEAFQSSPTEWLGVYDLADYAYFGQNIGAAQLSAVRRALIKLAPALNLKCSRVPFEKSLGWQNKYIQAEAFETQRTTSRAKLAALGLAARA